MYVQNTIIIFESTRQKISILFQKFLYMKSFKRGIILLLKPNIYWLKPPPYSVFLMISYQSWAVYRIIHALRHHHLSEALIFLVLLQSTLCWPDLVAPLEFTSSDRFIPETNANKNSGNVWRLSGFTCQSTSGANSPKRDLHEILYVNLCKLLQFFGAVYACFCPNYKPGYKCRIIYRTNSLICVPTLYWSAAFI